MLFSVVLLREQGVRRGRTPIEASEPMVGKLVVGDWREGNSAKRALRIAELKSTEPNHADLTLPLFDPVLVRANESYLILVGFEMHRLADDKLAEYQQCWLIRPVAGRGPAP